MMVELDAVPTRFIMATMNRNLNLLLTNALLCSAAVGF
jgi:hypothetical protein